MPRRRAFLIGVTAALAGCADGGSDGGAYDSPTETTVGETDTPSETPTDGTASPSDTPMDGTETPTATPASDLAEVDIIGSSFDPMRVSIEPGATVRWTNQDGYSHDVVSDQLTEDGDQWNYDSGTLAGGQTAEHTFDSEGAFEYYCTIHGASVMCGVVIVGGASHDATLPCE